MHLSSKLTRLRLGIETVLGLKRSGFFVPYARARNVEKFEHAGYSALREKFDNSRGRMSALIEEIERHRADLLAITDLQPPQPRFEQDWFPRLDAAAHYVMVRKYKPKRIIEIGSGHSTRWICRALADGGLQTQFTAVDPQPRADLGKLPVTLLRKPLQDIDLSLFDSIKPGDFVCMDSSHIFMPGSDVDVIINHVLPRLPAGAIIFFHDVFLPDSYPADWQPTGYNEQNAIAILLQGPFEVLFASAYATKYMADEIKDTVIAELKLFPGGIENGLWLRKAH